LSADDQVGDDTHHPSFHELKSVFLDAGLFDFEIHWIDDPVATSGNAILMILWSSLSGTWLNLRL
jgi:hypothetical protein